MTRYSKQLVKFGKDKLLTAHQLYLFTIENLKNIHVECIDTVAVQQNGVFIEERFAKASTRVSGCSGLHFYLPLSNSSMKVYQLPGILHMIMIDRYIVGSDDDDMDIQPEDTPQVTIGRHYAVLYDAVWWLGMVSEYSDVPTDLVY